MWKRLLVWTLGLTLLLGATVAPAGAADSAPAPTPTPSGAADSAPAPTPRPAVGGRLIMALESAPETFHPFHTTMTSGTRISEQIYATLVEFNEKAEPTPYVAKSWTVSPDGLTWTISLRQDVRFHDGTPLIAADVVYTLKALKEMGYTGLFGNEAIQDATATDPYTVRITLSRPSASLLGDINVGIVKQGTPGPAEPDLLKQPSAVHEHPIGAGPYRFVEYTPGYQVVLERNPDWFLSKEKGGAPFIQRLVYLYTGSRTVTLRAMAEGALDLAPVDIWRLPAARRAEVNAYYDQSWSPAYLSLNTTRPHLRSKAIRQALTYGMNRQALVDTIVPGATVPRSVILDQNWAFDPAVKTLDYDPDRARLLIEQEGYVLNPSGIYAKDGQPLKLELLVPATHEIAYAYAQSLKRQWLEIGVDLTIKVVEINTMYNSYVYPGQYDLFFGFVMHGPDPDPSVQFHSRSIDEMNYGRYSSPVVDRLLESGQQTADLNRRKAIYATVQQQLNDDAPVIMLYTGRRTISISKQVKGAIAFDNLVAPAYLYRWWINEQ